MRSSTFRIIAVCAACLPVTTEALLGLRSPPLRATFPLRDKATVSLKSVQNDGLPLDAAVSSLKALIQEALNALGDTPSIGELPSSSSITLPTIQIPPAFFDNSVVHELIELTSHVDPSTRPLLFAPFGALAAGSLLNAWNQIGETSATKAAGEVVATPYSGGQGAYNDEAAQEFYRARPLLVVKRLVTLVQLTCVFNTKLFLDFLSTPKGAESWVNEKDRAAEALVLANQMGPTFIKLGQAASIRTDLIPEPYALELRQLQDAVPPFDNDEALDVLRRELSVSDLGELFAYLSPAPVASASIGQVYRATLLDGRDVAVKVQRPSVLADIALDLYLLRLLAPLQVRISNAVNKLSTDDSDVATALALVDEWGRGFVAEVDYRLEAFNTKEFKAAMEARGLFAVTAPTVVDELSSGTVLVTEWVMGTRLDVDASSDVPRLCGVCINAYLTMLLDTGTLHCDPHPGNLLRTPEGKLCILDWGMTLRVPPELQYGLLEFIAHVNSEDYDAIPADFVNLGFTPPEQLDRVKSSGITEGLTFSLQLLSKGGGANKIRERLKEEFSSRYGEGLSDDEIRRRARGEMLERMEAQLASEGVDVNQVTNVMEEMSRRNKELFQLPPYVLYVSRAFSTLEGIGLSVDEDYAILQECFPYLARRLLTDNSPRARAALRSMLYGPPAGPAGEGAPLSLSEVVARSGASNGSGGGVAFAQAGVTQAKAHAPPSSGTHQPENPAHAVVRGGRMSSKQAKSGTGLLSPGKLAEMAEGFTSYTSATSNADSAKGVAAAGVAFADLLLADFDAAFDADADADTQAAIMSTWGPPFGNAGDANAEGGGGGGSSRGPNLVQEVLVEEAARLLDAAAVASVLDPLRSALSEALALSSGTHAHVLPGQKAYESFEASLPSPLLKRVAAATVGGPLQLSKRLATAARAAEPLFTKTDEDEQVIAAAGALREAIARAVPQKQTAGGSGPGHADGGSDTQSQPGLPMSPDAFSETAQAALSLLLNRDDDGDGGDDDTKALLSVLRDKGPSAFANLSRLLAASLLSRASVRLEGATNAQLLAGDLDEGGDVVRARRSAAATVLDPLLAALEGSPGK